MELQWALMSPEVRSGRARAQGAKGRGEGQREAKGREEGQRPRAGQNQGPRGVSRQWQPHKRTGPARCEGLRRRSGYAQKLYGQSSGEPSKRQCPLLAS